MLDDTVVIVSADHGENQGELNVYGDHQTPDQGTARIPLIVRWPGVTDGSSDAELYYGLDLPPTPAELSGVPIPERWDGRSLAGALMRPGSAGRKCLVLSQCAWSCQRGVRFGPYLLLRTYHDGYKELAPAMLYDVARDPHELHDIAGERPDLVDHGVRLLEQWHAEMMLTSESDVDPLWTVMREGGPFHTRGWLEDYARRLEATGRGPQAARLRSRHARGEWSTCERP